MELTLAKAVCVEPCRFFARREHRLTLPGSSEPIRYERLCCLKTDSCVGPDGHSVADPEGTKIPGGGTPCNPDRDCFESDAFLPFP